MNTSSASHRPKVQKTHRVGLAVIAAPFVAMLVALQPKISATINGYFHAPSKPPTTASFLDPQIRDGMALVPRGRFVMGAPDSNREPSSADAWPSREIELSEFMIYPHEVTNEQFTRFVDESGYITEAEQRGWSLVFDPSTSRWQKTNGASWRCPAGGEDSPAGKADFPVVQVTWKDALAYARWAGKRLPTEAEWERAARGGRSGADYPWGTAQSPGGLFKANYWQGQFPYTNKATDGYQQACVVGTFEPNPLGLCDMAGNVAEWCSDWYAEGTYSNLERYAPTGPTTGKSRVVRGGSWLSSANNGDGTRVWARESLPPTEANNHTGFRCVKDVE